MIDKEILREIGLTDDQIVRVLQLNDRIFRFRSILLSEGVSSHAAELIIQATKDKDLDLSNTELLKEKIRIEYGDFIVKKQRSVWS